MFRVIIAGGREFNDYNLLKEKCDSVLRNKKEVVIISGCARGADILGEKYANEKGFKIREYPADWNLGKKAGYLRNTQMAENADALIAFWDGVSKGTKNMIDIATKKGLLVRVIRYNK